MDQQGSQNPAQAQTAQVRQSVAQSGNMFLGERRTVSRLFILALTLSCMGCISFISWIMLVVRDPTWICFVYVPVYLVLLPMVVVSFILLKSWGMRVYCLVFVAMVMLWSTGLTAVVETSPMTRLKIISGEYDSCKNSGIVWGNNNRFSLCSDRDETWINYLVETVVVYDSSGEIAKRADQRSSAWNSAIIKFSRSDELKRFAEDYAGKKIGTVPGTNLPNILPGWGMFAENDHTVSPDFRAVHVYGNFYLVNFPVSPEDLSSIL